MCSTALCLQSSGSNEGKNMDPPLQDCTIEHQRGVVRFLWAEEVKPVEIHRRMLAQYGQSTMSQQKFYEWVERFKSGRTHYWWRSFWSTINIAQPKSLFPARIRKLVKRYNKCVVLQGDYLEKWYVKLLTFTSMKAVKCILPLLFDSPSYILILSDVSLF